MTKIEFQTDGDGVFDVPGPIMLALSSALGMTHKRDVTVTPTGVIISKPGEPQIELSSVHEIEVFIVAYLAGVKDERWDRT